MLAGTYRHLGDRRGGVLVNIADPGFHGQHQRDARPSFLHVAAVGDEYQAGFDGVDAHRSHVALDALERQALDGRAPHRLPGVHHLEDPIDDGCCEDGAIHLVVLAAYRHPHVVQESGHQYRHAAVLDGAGAVGLEAGLDSGRLEQVEHAERIDRDRAHMHGTVVVEVEAPYRHHVGVLLEGLRFLVGDEQLGGA